ncbi:unnamed protein product [Heterobilharzia americana]|nr:unnamed protein product [Heterobilharzia americana]
MISFYIVVINFLNIIKFCKTSEDKIFHPLSDELIEYINTHPNAGWKAGKTSRFNTINDAHLMMGALFEDSSQKAKSRPTINHNDNDIELPKFFDARKHWRHCSSIKTIRDQSACGSCWAFGAVEAMSDRICIHSSSYKSVELSAVNLLSCCTRCGFGCRGGIPGFAWDYWKDEGIVTGGSNKTHTGCQPYPFPECVHHSAEHLDPSCETESFSTPECQHYCQNDYQISYEDDKFYGKTSYNVASEEGSIMKEILLNGPVEGAFLFMKTFLTISLVSIDM